MDIDKALDKLKNIEPSDKYMAMLKTASIITGVLDKQGIKPIIVGGLSVMVYTQQNYTTRDIDFVSDGFEQISDVLKSLGFTRKTRHFYRDDIEVAVEVPDSFLAGDYTKVKKVFIDDEHYIYLISIEDLILDRLRAYVHWTGKDERKWGFKMLASNIDAIDIPYMIEACETPQERTELEHWLERVKY